MIEDSKLKSMIESVLLNDPRLSSHVIDVSVANGRVSLKGTVQSYRRLLVVRQIVERFDEVVGVECDLKVSPREFAADEDVERHVRSALESSADLTPGTIKVSVTGGKVTLNGAVGSYWEQTVAEDVARGVRGVRSVANLLVVNLKEKVTDEELANTIKAALMRELGPHSEQLGVTVTGASVCLSGCVAEPRLRRKAEAVVRSFGLLHLENVIEVA